MGNKNYGPAPTSTDKYDYYAFISYKHSRDDGKFEEDTKWATELDKELRYLSIPTEIDKTLLIHPEDDSVDPVFRDVTGLPIVKNGQLEQVLKRKLRSSKALVLILSKEMVKEENEKYEKGEAWIYWEIKQFKNFHGKDALIIPVYIDKDDYSPDKVPTAIGIEKNFQNIEKPYQSYRSEYDWASQKTLFFQRTAASVAASIFGIDKEENKAAFWNIKQRARQADEAEKKRSRLQKIFLLFIFGVVAAVAVFFFNRYSSSRSDTYVKEAREALDSGNRGLAIRLAEKAHAARKANRKAYEVMWAANDSTRAYMTVDSPVSFNRNDSLYCYVDQHKFLVVVDAASFEEVDRIDAGMASEASLSPSGNRLFVQNYKKMPPYRFFDRITRQWREEKDYLGEHSAYWLSDDAVLFGFQLFTANGAFVIGDGTVDGSSSYDYKRASFVESDSLLITLRSEGPDGKKPGVRVYLYKMNLSQEGHEPFSWYHPLHEFPLGKDITGGDLMPETNLVMAYSTDSVFTYRVEWNEGKYALVRELGENLKQPIVWTEPNSAKEGIFAVDTSGAGHVYSILGSISPRMGHESLASLQKKSPNHSALCGSVNRESFYYLGNDVDINLYDGRTCGYHLPFTPSRMHVKGSRHGKILCIETSDEQLSYGSYTSYLYTAGDRRDIRPKYTQVMLSSEYAVCLGMDLYVTYDSLGRERSRSSSRCLFNPLTGKHLMHLDQIEDEDNFLGGHYDYHYSDNGLAIAIRRRSGDQLLRIYDLNQLLMVSEVPLGHEGWFVRWLDDGSFLYSKEGTLMRGWKDSSRDHVTVSEQFNGYLVGSTSGRFVFQNKRSADYNWFSHKDGHIRHLESERMEWLSPKGDYYVMRPSSNSPMAIVDAINLDTLALYPLKNPLDYYGYYEFSKDGKKYVFSDGQKSLVCLKLPDGRECWRRAIWPPISSVVGDRYLVVQSSSLYVLDLKSGKTVCEFETTEWPLKLMLSPDEQWLLAGDKLYSITNRQMMATGLDESYTGLENRHIVYARHLMKLPNVESLFD